MKFTFFLLLSVFSGIVLVGQVERAAVVEHFTNTRCSICGSKNPAMYQTLENYPEVIHIAYHPSSPYSNCIFSQHNPVENDARTNHFGVYGGTPRVVVNGSAVAPSTPLLPEDVLAGAVGGMTDFSVSINHTLLPDETVQAEVMIKRVAGKGSENLIAYVVLTERLIEYAAPNGENVHHDVFRKVLLNQVVNLPNTNDSIVLTGQYSTHEAWNQEEIQVVALLQKESDKSLVQAARSGFAAPVASVVEKTLPDGAFYPNPATSFLHFAAETRQNYERVELFSLFGTKMLETVTEVPLDLQSFAPGTYFLVFTGHDGKIATATFILSNNR